MFFSQTAERPCPVWPIHKLVENKHNHNRKSNSNINLKLTPNANHNHNSENNKLYNKNQIIKGDSGIRTRYISEQPMLCAAGAPDDIAIVVRL